MSEETLQVLTDAIKNRRCCAIRYRDQSQLRIVEPHAIYRDERHGEILVDCYQIRGYSSANRLPPFWRPFRLAKITAVAPLADTFAPRISEGFDSCRARYRRGLICIVADRGLPFVYPFTQTGEPVGPMLPRHRTRR